MQILVFVCYLSIAQIILPYFNKGEDFFFFAKWSMFSNGSKGISYDISWDEGETFLFRDYKEEAKSLGINVHIIAYLVNSAKYEKLKNFKSSLTKIASPDKIAIF